MAHFRSLVVSLAVAVALSGCAGGQTRGSGFDAQTQKDLTAALVQAFQKRGLIDRLPPDTTVSQFTVQIGLKILSDLHVAPRSSFELVAAGFANLARKEPDFHFSIGDRDLEVSSHGERLHRFALPLDRAFDQWGREVDRSIQEYLKKRSGSGGLSPDALYDAFLEGMADAPALPAIYQTRDDVRLQERFMAGEIADVGLSAEVTDAGAVIRAILDIELLDNPLLTLGNAIVSIDGQPVSELDQEGVERRLLGPAGSSVILGILEKGKSTPASVTVRRTRMDVPSLRSQRVGDLLHVEIVRFDRDTAISLSDALKQAAQSGPTPLKGVILDLRSNPMGQMDSGVAVADIFLAEGTIVSTLGRQEITRRVFEARANAPTNPLPLVVLIREEAAGMPEVVASALQDLERAIVVGQTSGGEGRLSTGIRLPNGGGLRIPFGETLASSGYRLNKRGVMPTVCTGGEVTAAAVLAALRAGNGVVDYATRTRDIDPEDGAAVSAFRRLCPPRSDGNEDVSLKVAKALLEDPVLYDAVLARGSKAMETAAQ